MPEIQVRLPRYGPRFRLVSRAQIKDNVVTGQLDFPPYPELDLAHHFPGKPLFPGVESISLMFQIVQTFCTQTTESRLFPVLTGMPLVRFYNLTRPGEITVQAEVFQDGTGGVATCHTFTSGKERSSAIFTFKMSVARPPEVVLPLPLEQISIDPKQGKISGVYHYQGEECLSLANLEVIPFPLVIEALCQNAIQIGNYDPGLENALFVVTHLRDTVFHGNAPVDTLNLCTEVEWTDKRGLVHALASSGGKPIASGDFGFVILNARRS